MARCEWQPMMCGALQSLPALSSGSDTTTDARTGVGLVLGPLHLGPVRGCVRGYSKTKVTAAFTPTAVGMVQRQVTLTFRQGFSADNMQITLSLSTEHAAKVTMTNVNVPGAA